MELIPKLIQEDKNKAINVRISREEVEIAVKQMHADKATGLDRFPIGFFHKFWEAIGQELVEALEVAINSGSLLKELNNTFIALIPKK